MSRENPFFWQPAFWKQLPITTKACCENSKAISARYLKDATSKLMLIHTMLFSFNWPSSFGTCSSLKWLFHMLILLPLKSPDFCNFLSQKTFLHPQIRLRAKKGLSVQRDISFWMMCLFFPQLPLSTSKNSFQSTPHFGECTYSACCGCIIVWFSHNLHPVQSVCHCQFSLSKAKQTKIWLAGGEDGNDSGDRGKL